jgi:hypothetical protein
MQSTLLPADHEPKGYEENGMVKVNVQDGDRDLVPSDWRYFVFYSYNVRSFEQPSPGTLYIESWVAEWTDEDAQLLQSGVFEPTNN